MRKTSKRFAIFLALILVFTSFVGCGNESNDEVPPVDPKEVAAPPEVQAVKDKVTGLAADYATQLNGEYADAFNLLMASGEGRDYAGYADLKATLDGFLTESGARYVYIIVDKDPADEFFDLTIDAGDAPDDWMVQYEIEGQFTDAMNGVPSPALSAWYDDPENSADTTWSAFAPIYDSENKIVGLLGIDYPAPEIDAFPEWNRDTDTWNKVHY